jgi:hypothetical protein
VRAAHPGDQPQCQGDRNRIVGAGLCLQRTREPTAEACTPQGCEHRRGIGCGDDRAEQQRLRQREVEQTVGGDPRDGRGDDDPDRREKKRGRHHLAQPAPRGGQTALVQDRRQRDDTDLAGELGVVERDAARAVRAEQHAEDEEGDQRRQAGLRRTQRNGDARRQYAADGEHGQADVQTIRLPIGPDGRVEPRARTAFVNMP